MNKVAHYNGFVGRCQQYGLTKQAADMLYKNTQWRLEKQAKFEKEAFNLGIFSRITNRPRYTKNYQSNGWAPRGAPTASDKPWLEPDSSIATAIPEAPYDPGSIDPYLSDSYGAPGFQLADEATAPMTGPQRMYSRANPNFAGWFNAHQESVRKVLDQYPEFDENGEYGGLSREKFDFREHPETANHMSKIYHDSMYNLTNNTPKVTAPTLANR